MYGYVVSSFVLVFLPPLRRETSNKGSDHSPRKNFTGQNFGVNPRDVVLNPDRIVNRQHFPDTHVTKAPSALHERVRRIDDVWAMARAPTARRDAAVWDSLYESQIRRRDTSDPIPP